MRIIFAGTPEFSVAPLLALIEQHDVVAVFTQPDRQSGRGKKLTAPPVKDIAITKSIPVYQPDTLKNQADLISSLEADVMVVVAYGMLLPQTILDIPKLGCINIHASILPRWRGAAPIQRAVEAGDLETGVSIMQMAAGLDTGPVYQTLKTPIKPDDNSASLHDTLSTLGAQGVIETLNKLNRQPNWQPTQQNDADANYARKISKEEGNINWQQPAHSIDCKIRAFNPWPICQTYHAGQTRIRLWQANHINKQHSATPGEIIDIDESGIIVACGENALQLSVLQKDGGKPLPHKHFLNGHSISLGDVLG